MKHRNYFPILTKNTQKVFFDYINSVNIPQIDYFAIGIQNTVTKKSISLMSRKEWQDHFTTQHYAERDPIRRVTLATKRKIIFFEEIDFLDNFGKEIMRQRALMNIKNGIILMERFPRYNYMVTMGTGFSKFDAFNFLKRYYQGIRLIKNDLIKLVEKETKNFLTSEL